MKYKPGKWYRFELNEKLDSDFPCGINFSGNYVIFTGKTCLYVGQSNNVLKRLKSHIQIARYSNWWKTRWGQYIRLTIAIRKERCLFERMMVEARFINRLNPLCNIFREGQQIHE